MRHVQQFGSDSLSSTCQGWTRYYTIKIYTGHSSSTRTSKKKHAMYKAGQEVEQMRTVLQVSDALGQWEFISTVASPEECPSIYVEKIARVHMHRWALFFSFRMQRNARLGSWKLLVYVPAPPKGKRRYNLKPTERRKICLESSSSIHV